MFVNILFLVHFAFVVAILITLIAGVMKRRIAKVSALLLGALTLIFAILPQIIIKMSGAWQKVEYYFIYGVALIILLVIGTMVRKRYREIQN